MSVRNEQNPSQPLTGHGVRRQSALGVVAKAKTAAPTALSRAINVGDLVIGKERKPSYVIFRVLSISRNGWLRCQHDSDQEGIKCLNGFTCHFRNSDMVPWGGRP